MTPLAFDLLKDLTTRGAFRTTSAGPDDWRPFAWDMLNECKFFEMTAVVALADQQADRMERAFTESRGERVNARLAFLPAPMTWIEVDVPTGRYAFILLSKNSVSDCKVVRLERRAGAWEFGNPLSDHLLPLIESGARPALDEIVAITKRLPARTEAQKAALPDAQFNWRMMALGYYFFPYALLAIINSPRIIGRRQHMPHERVERDKLKSLGLVGKFPLRAWTEIVLTVAPPDDRTGEPSAEAHLTGEKCLHYCRTHLRWCDGRLEYVPVEGHWRGNPALGFKRSRYRVEDDGREQ